MAEASPDYTNSSQQCLMAVVDLLGKHLLSPLTISDVSAALDPPYQPDQVRRALWNLEARGWVEKLHSGYVLSPSLTVLADRMRLQLIELNRKYLETNSHA